MTYINSDANFCTFPTALLTMFRASTGEEWNGLMHDLLNQDTEVVSIPWAALPFFISYVLISTFIVLKVRDER